ncbi:MAG: hypothetical protein OXU26_16335 [Acidobacteriota bacterium]|nr:hypothetical protein [Acidobacteriota bacterium]
MTRLQTLFRLKRARTRSGRYLRLGSLLLLTSACGKIGEPLPPLIRIPQPIADLTVRQQGAEVILGWTLPHLNTDGSTAATLASMEIYRAIREPSPDTTVAPAVGESDLWRVLQTEPARGRQEARSIRDLLEGRDLSEVLEREFSYAVKVFNRKGQSAGLSNIATLRLQPVPHPPGRPSLKPAEEYVEVSWAPSSINIDGSPVAAGVTFNLYRASSGRSSAGGLLNPTPVAGTSYRDGSARLGETYLYRVRALLETGRGGVESRDSEEATLFHRDLYPPGPPRQLTLVAGREFLSLAWFPNSESDLAGYHVFRRQGRDEFQRLTATATQRTSYEDRDLLEGLVHAYRVTAVDRAGNQSSYSNVVSDTLE